MLSSCPLVFGGNHILVIFAKNIRIRTGFFRAQNAKISCPWRPSPVRLLCYLAVLLADYFRRHGNIIISTGARSLIIKMSVYETACSTLDVIVLPPCYLEGNHILVIFAPNTCIRNSFFGLQVHIFPCPGAVFPRSVASLPSQITFGDMEI